MRTIYVFIISLLLLVNNYISAQSFGDSIHYSIDKIIPSYVVLSQKQIADFTLKTKGLDTVQVAANILKKALVLDKDMTVELQNWNIDYNGDLQISFSQNYKGLKVEHTRSIVHYKDDAIKSVNGNFRTIKDLSVIPVLSESQALQKALSYINAKKYAWEDEKQEQWVKQIREDLSATTYPKGELVIYFNNEDLPVLAYKFSIHAIEPHSEDFIYINAITGKTEGRETQNCHVAGTAMTRYSGQKTIETERLSNNTYRLHDYSRGGIKTFNMKGGSVFDDSDFIDNDNNWTSSEWNKY